MRQKLTQHTSEDTLSALIQIKAATRSAQNARALAQAALASALAALDLPSGSIWVQESERLVCLAAYPAQPGGRPQTASAAIARVLERGQPELWGDPSFSSADQAARIPLVARGKLLGVLELIAGQSEPSRPLAEALADAIAGALDQMLLAEQVDEQRRRLDALKRQQDELISIISHDLKNPMASIKGYADLLLRRSARLADDPNRRGLQVISEQIVRMTGLLDKLLDISRIAGDRLRLDPRPADLAWLVTEVVEQAREASGRHNLALEGASAACPGVFDVTRVRQAIEGVVDNALAYSPAGSHVLVELRRSGDEALIAIQDHGVGIPPAERERIFEAFFRASNAASHSGMGMGLYVARQILGLHRGRIWFESEQGEGSTFFITLPLAAEEQRLSA